MSHASTMATNARRFLLENSMGLDTILIISVFLAALSGLLFGEKIQANQGFGYDGVEYAHIAEHLENLLENKELDNYRIQRILPSVLVHYALKSLSVPFTPAAIIYAFGFLNVTLLTIVAAVWCRIANHLKISALSKMIGAVSLFVNFAVLKMTAFYPVLTDTAAFAMGIVALFFYLIGFRVGLFFLMVAGAFTWPTAAYQCALLIVFPRSASTPELGSSISLQRITAFVQRYQKPMLLGLAVVLGILWSALHFGGLSFAKQQITYAYTDPQHWLRKIMPMRNQSNVPLQGYLEAVEQISAQISAGMLALFALAMLLLSWTALPGRIRRRLPPPNFWLALSITLLIGLAISRFYRLEKWWYDPIGPLLPVSAGLTLCYVFVGIFRLWDSPSLFVTSYWLRGVRVQSLLAVASVLFGITLIQSWLSADSSTSFVFENIILHSIEAPARFLAMHPMYFGPIILVAVLCWKEMSASIRNYGAGLMLVTSLAFLLSITSESRLITNFFPLFVMLSVGVLDARGALSTRNVVAFTMLSLFVSRFWLKIGGAERLYFANHGPFMSRDAYWIFLISAIMIMVCVHKLFRASRNI